FFVRRYCFPQRSLRPEAPLGMLGIPWAVGGLCQWTPRRGGVWAPNPLRSHCSRHRYTGRSAGTLGCPSHRRADRPCPRPGSGYISYCSSSVWVYFFNESELIIDANTGIGHLGNIPSVDHPVVVDQNTKALNGL